MVTDITHEFLYDWCFFYNPYEKLWYAVKREYKDLYFSNKDSIPSEAVIKNKSNQNILNYLTQINGGKLRSSDNTHSGRKVTS